MENNHFSRLKSFFKKGASEIHAGDSAKSEKKPLAKRPFGRALMTLMTASILAGAVMPITAQPAQAQSYSSSSSSMSFGGMNMTTWIIIYAVILSDSPEKLASSEYPTATDFVKLNDNLSINADTVSAIWYDNGSLKIADGGRPTKIDMSQKEANIALDKMGKEDNFIRVNDTTFINIDTASTLADKFGYLRLTSGADNERFNITKSEMQNIFKNLSQKEDFANIDGIIVNLKQITHAYRSGLGSLRYKISGSYQNAYIDEAPAKEILKELASHKAMIDIGKEGVININMADYIKLDGDQIKAHIQSKTIRETIDADKLDAVRKKILQNKAFIQISDENYLNMYFHDEFELKGDILRAKTFNKWQKFNAESKYIHKAFAKLGQSDKFFALSKTRTINLSSIEYIEKENDGDLTIKYSKGSSDIEMSARENQRIYDSLSSHDKFFAYGKDKLINKNAVKQVSFQPESWLHDELLSLQTKSDKTHITYSSERISKNYIKNLADKYPHLHNINGTIINSNAASIYSYKNGEITFSYGKREQDIKASISQNSSFMDSLEKSALKKEKSAPKL